MRTPLARVLGPGSSHRGTSSFWRQRLSSIALVPLTVFVFGLALSLIGADHDTLVTVVGRPFVAIPLVAFVALAAYHMKIGMQEIIEDYVSGGARIAAQIANLAFCSIIALTAGYAVVKLGLGS
ncbi:MAG: succinate dehydrogenase, hydrophobic membrane anchor protein [Bauldia sp.]|nr:succinate dehydrogenase, hydrophobic membrane anchor protein [Bauldia sp.]